MIGVNGVLEMRLNVTCNKQRSINVLHYRVDQPWDVDTLNEEYDAIWARLYGAQPIGLLQAFTNCLADNATFDFVDLQYVAPTRYTLKRFFPVLSSSQQEKCTAQNVSATIVKRTERAGRMYRGGVHIPAVPEDKYLEGELSTGYLTDLGILCTELMTNITDPALGGISKPTLYHRKVVQSPFSTDLTSCVYNTALRTMRSRNVGKGI